MSKTANKSTETTSGSEILEQVSTEVLSVSADALKNVLKLTVKMINDRERWAAIRHDQVAELKALQTQLVKDFDNGKLDKVALSELTSNLNNEGLWSACRVKIRKAKQQIASGAR